MEKTLTDAFLEKMKTSILLRVLVVVVGVGVGLFAFILPIRNYVPVARETQRFMSAILRNWNR